MQYSEREKCMFKTFHYPLQSDVYYYLDWFIVTHHSICALTFARLDILYVAIVVVLQVSSNSLCLLFPISDRYHPNPRLGTNIRQANLAYR